MQPDPMQPDPQRSPWKGFLAGAAGGLAASFAMSQFHSLLQQAQPAARPVEEEDSTVRVASAISRIMFRHELTPQQKKLAGPAVHYGFGAGVAAVYGTAVEFAPSLRTGWGAPFGAAVWLGMHVIAVPALGFSQPVSEAPLTKEAVEFGGHLLYGTVVEGVRVLLRSA